MLAAMRPSGQPPEWQRLLQQAITDPAELATLLGLPSGLIEGSDAAATGFRMLVPRGFAARMKPGDPCDPLLRQVLPLASETERVAGFVTDPVGDMAARTGSAPGVLHKYHGRALLIATGTCAVNCRYCFRRHFPYEEENASRHGFEAALEFLRSDPCISEVILSGGDPLMLSDRRLGALAGELTGIGHLRRLRIHTRLPIVLPERIDAGFLRWWSQVPLQKVVVVHANHANEIDAAVRAALHALRADGTTLLNQSVLLRGVNDDVDSLVALSEALFEAAALPYYLHLMDPVAGAHHFVVPQGEARILLRGLADRLPGFLVPRLVREVPGAGAKLMLPPASR